MDIKSQILISKELYEKLGPDLCRASMGTSFNGIPVEIIKLMVEAAANGGQEFWLFEEEILTLREKGFIVEIDAATEEKMKNSLPLKIKQLKQKDAEIVTEATKLLEQLSPEVLKLIAEKYFTQYVEKTHG